MHYNTAIITFVVGTNAIKIQSQLQTEDFVDELENIGKGIADAAETVGEFTLDVFSNIGKSTLALTDYIGSPDGFAGDFGYLFTDDFGQDLLNTAESIFTGDLFVDGYNWMADGDNWDALGKVAAASWMNVLTGDYESAWNLSTDWDLYEGKNWK